MRKIYLLLPLVIAFTAVLAFTLVQEDSSEAAVDGAAMSLRVDPSQTTSCPGGPTPGKVCVPKNQKFDVIVVADAIPLTKGYRYAQVWIDYGNTGLVHKKNTQILWPDCEPNTFGTSQDVGNNAASAACATNIFPPFPISIHKGDLFSFSLTCTAGSHVLNLIPAGTQPANTSGGLYLDSNGLNVVPGSTGLNVNCSNPPVNLTPTPALPPFVDVQCTELGGGQNQTKCTHPVGAQVEILGVANYAQDTDKNGKAGYHGVDLQITWPAGLGVDEKATGLVCPPGAIPAKLATGAGKWASSCHLPSQINPGDIPPCPIQPDLPFPDAGCDTFDSIGAFDVNLTNPPVGSLHCEVAGVTQVTRSAVIPSVLDFIATEIVFMSLTGLCDGTIPITVVESPTINSFGDIQEQTNNNPGTLEFPADSFFDVFVEVQTPFGNFHNDDPIDMSCKIDGLPPYLCPYGSTLTPQIFDGAHKLIGTIKHSEHVPKKTLQGEALYAVILTCEQEGTFTVTVGATFTREAKDLVGPVFDTVDITCGKQDHPGDTDGDGCSDVDENRPKGEANLGGGRDYLNPWDYYDVLGGGGGPPDQIIDLSNDIFGVIIHYYPNNGGGANPYPVGHEVFDRGPSTGPNPWNMTAPDGVIDLSNDILGVIQQYLHDCRKL